MICFERLKTSKLDVKNEKWCAFGDALIIPISNITLDVRGLKALNSKIYSRWGSALSSPLRSPYVLGRSEQSPLNNNLNEVLFQKQKSKK